MSRILTRQQLIKAQSRGAKIIRKPVEKVDPPPAGKTQDLSKLIDTMHMQRREQNERIDVLIGKVERIIEQKPENTGDLAGAIEHLAAIQSQPKSGYHFKVERDGRNLMTGVTVTPNEQLLN